MCHIVVPHFKIQKPWYSFVIKYYLINVKYSTFEGKQNVSIFRNQYLTQISKPSKKVTLKRHVDSVYSIPCVWKPRAV